MTSAAFDDIERRLFNTVLPPSRSGGGPAGRATVATSGPSAPDALTAVLERLKRVEAENSDLQSQIVQLEREKAPKHQPGAVLATPDVLEELADLREENAALRSRVRDMEAFLAEYGLRWVGNGDGDDGGAVTAVEGPSRGSSSSGDGDAAEADVDLDFPLLKLRIAQLNELVGAGKARVVAVGGVHKLEVPRELPLILYADGFVLGDTPVIPAGPPGSSGAAYGGSSGITGTSSTSASSGPQPGPFTRYGSPAGRAFLQDVMDGFFPSALRAAFPEGVPLGMLDRTTITFAPSLPPKVSTGGAASAPSAGAKGSEPGATGAGAGAAPDAPQASSLTVEQRLARLARLGQPELPVTSAAALLASLPTRVVAADGALVPVRSGVAAFLAGTPAPGASSGTASSGTAAAASAAAAPGTGTGTSAGGCTVQLRIEEALTGLAGSKAVSLPADATVGDLRFAAAGACIAGTSASSIELRVAFPVRRALEDDGETLAAARLVPSGVVHVQRRK